MGAPTWPPHPQTLGAVRHRRPAPRSSGVPAGAEPRYRFFGGKGGVGKTSCAAAAAVAAAESGRRVLVVSTDPAHSLGDVLATGLTRAPRRIATRRGRLHAVELDADRALERWMARRRSALRMLAERGTYFDREDVDRLLRLSLPGVDELIGLVELTRLARDGAWDEIVVDTAPTGHTLRLLAMPATLRRIAGVLDDMHAKHRFLAQSLGGGRYRPDAGDALIAEVESEGEGLGALLRDARRCTFTWLLLPEALALAEARDAVGALEGAGLHVAEIVVNRVSPPPAAPCPHCAARVAAEAAMLQEIRRAFAGRPLRVVPALDTPPSGVAALRAFARRLAAAGSVVSGAPAPDGSHARARRAAATTARAERDGERGGAPSWLDVVAPRGVRLVLVCGKGGVGKTSCAVAIALALAERAEANRVLLLSTDPAHSLADALDTPLGDAARAVPEAPSGLRARELDAAAAFERRRTRYREAVDALFAALRGDSSFDPTFDRAVIEDLIELAPPGLDELFGMLAIIEAVVDAGARAAAYDAVVVDTAPTGHALRLLALPDAALQWVRALLAILLKYRAVMGLGSLAADLVEISRDLRALQTLLRDRARTRAVVVTRPGALERRETARLSSALRRLRIAVSAVIVNAVTPPGCARCRTRAARDARDVRAAAAAGRPVLQAPLQAPPPRGVRGLRAWGATWRVVNP